MEPDYLDLLIRDINKSRFDYRLPLDNWKMEEVEYIKPGCYKKTGWTGTINPGDEWDNTGKTFYFTRKVEVPRELIGKKIYLEVDIGGESAIYINGSLKRGLNEELILLSERAEAEYDILIEATYDVHNYVKYPRFHGREYPRHFFKKVNLVVLNELVDEYYYFLSVIKDLLNVISSREEEHLLRKALEDSLKEIEFHTDNRGVYVNSIKEALQVLKKGLSRLEKYKHPGELVFTAHSHLDLAFKWTLKETIRKSKRTLSTTVDLMERYHDLFFVQSQPQLLKYVKDNYPRLYRKVKQQVREGRLEPIGGMWVESDTNLTSGESLIRQILYGKKFLEKEFGIRTRTCWLPDCFGFSAILPQILKKSGLDYFITTKLNWNDTNEFPYNTFVWQGVDGSEVYGYLLPRGYGGEIEPREILNCWDNFKNKAEANNLLYLYGYGDGGGGITEEMMKRLKATSEIPLLPDCKFSRVEDHLQELFNDAELPHWRGELYLEKHRGVYTSQAILKKKNRHSELLYRKAELLSVISTLLGHEVDYRSLHQGWELILKNQFHDILPGSCIRGVVDDALKDYEKVEAIGEEVVTDSLQGIFENVNTDGDSIVVFNTLSWERTDLVEINYEGQKFSVVRDENGKILPVQWKGDYGYFVAENIPPSGYKCYTPVFEDDENGDRINSVYDEEAIMGSHGDGSQLDHVYEKKDKKFSLENKYFYLEFNDRGNLTTLYDKRVDRDLIPEGEEGNNLQLFEDKSTYFDVWDIRISEDKKYNVEDVEEIGYGQNGPVYRSLVIKKAFNRSKITQEIIIYDSIPRIDFKTEVDWQERQMLLKAAFPLDIQSDRATYDIGLASIERSTHRNTSWDRARWEVPAHKWADLSEYGYGVSLLNNCKYGYDIKDNIMRITLLKGGIFPDPEADLGIHNFTYSLFPHVGDLREGGTIKQGYYLNEPLKGLTVIDVKGQNILPPSHSFVNLDSDNVVLETLKFAEEGQGIIIRCYESYGQKSKVTIEFFKPPNWVIECDLMEEPLDNNSEIRVRGNRFSFEINPYEIKTFKIDVT
ncbi:alpha-mannosidase [Halothermothrix orenii]|uniref:Alpha-mannosidase n=1 Tax=Halothermothrix orenii (strain H 168 / OCM 544 / DSM 9562) TaxID=373903 RepID=B8CY22_HALOH|nr:glycoside hydrolase family 38 C-terminal domain-containing protein [Halothermothrix orenii]ACL70191.1 Alpha-mannosidase [Halothermothrix orenii H 168]